jgi:hypothetical protein
MASVVTKRTKNRTQVLIIGMLDSIHLARWLDQFKKEEIDFLIFASKKFKKIHGSILPLLNTNFEATYRLHKCSAFEASAGYWDFLMFELPRKLGLRKCRSRSLKRLLNKVKFHHIHAFEIQGAGYLLDDIDENLIKNSKVIVTNWGSDIYYFGRYPDHKESIKSILSKADYYSAECIRDYALAKDFGFKGIDLPCIPNAGGFHIAPRGFDYIPPSLRKQVLVKGYGGTFGRADLPIALIPQLLNNFPEIQFHFYSVTDDILRLIKQLPQELKTRIRVSTLRDRLTHTQMLREFAISRIYVGCSESDGISTSFIESLIHGTYPIQTNTSCANEWVDRGVTASIIGLNSDELLLQIQRALEDDALVDSASDVNFQVANRFLAFDFIRKQSLSFYL